MHNFGITQKAIEKASKKEKELDELLTGIYDEVVKHIKSTTEGTDAYVTFVAKDLKLENDEKPKKEHIGRLLYLLQSNPNLVSKIEEESGGRKLAEKMRPYSFRWVDADEKKNLALSGFGIKGLNENRIAFLDAMLPSLKAAPLDVLKCFSYLISKGAEDAWIELNAYQIAVTASIPIENCMSALQDMVDTEMIVVGEYKTLRGYGFGSSKELKKYAVTITYESADVNKRREEATNLEYLYKAVLESKEQYAATHKHTSNKAKIEKETRELTEDFAVSEENEQAILEKVAQAQENSAHVAAVKIDLKGNKKQIKKNIDNNNNFGKMIIAQINAYVEEQTSSLKETLEQALYERNKLQLAVEKLTSEKIDLQGDLEKEQASHRKLKEQFDKVKAEREAFKNYSDVFAMNAQDQLMIMRRRIAKLATEYSDRPRYEQTNELIAAKFSDDVTKTAEEISRNIINYTPESKFAPDLRK